MLPINLISVIIAAVAAFFLGFLFHGPILGKLWMKLANIHPTGNEKFSDMIPKMLMNLLVQVVTAYVIAAIYLFTSGSPYIAKGIGGGVELGIWLWVGFLVTSSSIEVIWMGRNYKLWLYEAFCSFIAMAAMGAIIAAW